MNRRSLAEFTHKADAHLNVKNSNYKQWVFRYTFLELEKDLFPAGDITTDSLFAKDFIATAKVFAREKGVIAGLAEMKYFLIDADPKFRPSTKGEFDIDFLVEDGDLVKEDDVVLKISGSIHDLLKIERVILNLLGRMSGVETKTAQIVKKLGDSTVLLTPTRKTLWGLLDKRAVFLGGGGTHRLNLSDAVLVKDNHLEALNYDFKEVLERVTDNGLEFRFIEIEVDSEDRAFEAAEAIHSAIKTKKLNSVAAILLDNMRPEQIERSLKRIKKAGFYDEMLFEASGGISEKNILDYAKTPVDIVSMGALTTSAASLDFSMRLS